MIAGAHLTEEQIEQYAMGKLSPNCCEDLEEHLLICESCQLSLEETDTYLTHMKVASARVLVAQEQPSIWDKIRGGLSQRMAKPLPVFAGLACAAAIAVVLIVPRPAPPSPQQVTLESLRGGKAEAPYVEAKRAIQFSLDATGLPEAPSYVANIVDESGKLVQEAPANRSADTVAVRSESGLPAGKFMIRILNPKRDLLREYAISVK